MQRKKPTALLVIGILNLVFGGMSLLTHCCCGGVFGLFYIGLRSAAQQVRPEDRPDLEELSAIFANIPGLVPVMFGILAVGLVLALVQAVSGIGLVRAQSWGRWSSAMWALLQVLAVAATLLYQFVFIYPNQAKFVKDFEEFNEKQQQRQQQRGQQPVQQMKIQSSGNPFLDNAFFIILQFVDAAYAGIVFLIMILPHTGRAIATYHGQSDDLGREPGQNFDDDEHLRSRRVQDQPPD